MTMKDGLKLDLQSIVRQLDLHQGKADMAGIGQQIAKARELVKESVTLLGRGKDSRSTDSQ